MIDKNKTYKTRDGREVRIYATDGIGCAAVHGAIYQPTGCSTVSSNQPGMEWCVTVWHISGQHMNRNFDLIEVKPRIKRTVWIDILKDHEVINYDRTQARHPDLEKPLACVKVEIDCEEKEGL